METPVRAGIQPVALSGSSVTSAELEGSAQIVGRASPFVLSWSCGLWCMNAWILDINLKQHSSLLQPLSAPLPSSTHQDYHQSEASHPSRGCLLCCHRYFGTCCSSTAKFEFSTCAKAQKPLSLILPGTPHICHEVETAGWFYVCFGWGGRTMKFNPQLLA